MTSEKKIQHKLSINFYDKEFLSDINAYSEFLSITRSEAIYNLAKKGFEHLSEDLNKEDLVRLRSIREMLIEIDKKKK